MYPGNPFMYHDRVCFVSVRVDGDPLNPGLRGCELCMFMKDLTKKYYKKKKKKSTEDYRRHRTQSGRSIPWYIPWPWYEGIYPPPEDMLSIPCVGTVECTLLLLIIINTNKTKTKPNQTKL